MSARKTAEPHATDKPRNIQDAGTAAQHAPSWAAHRRSSTCPSHSSGRFQLAKVWLTVQTGNPAATSRADRG
jgi:hypothetical protein